MPLYRIRDADCPAFVVANSFQGAIDKWKWAVARENDITMAEVDDPRGVEFACRDAELIVAVGWVDDPYKDVENAEG